MSKKTNLNYLVKIALFSAVATVGMLFEVVSPIDFLKFDLSDVPATIGAFVLGPVAGVIIEFMKNILKLIVKGTMTMTIGEWANFIIGSSFVFPAALYYKKDKTFKGAAIGVTLGVISMTVIGAVMNYYVLLPAYSQYIFMETYTAVFGGITGFKTLVLFGVVPFNIVKGILTSTVVLLSYKFIVPPLMRISE